MRVARSEFYGGPSINPHWHVPRALHSLEGEIDTAKRIIERLDSFLEQRIAGFEHVHELGVVSTAIMVSALVAERALKSLIAQTQPTVQPKKTHGLANLFAQLEAPVQEEIRAQYRMMQDWVAHYEDIEEVFSVASKSFEAWRYTMEDRTARGGIPRDVLKAGAAVHAICFRYLRMWQREIRSSCRR